MPHMGRCCHCGSDYYERTFFVKRPLEPIGQGSSYTPTGLQSDETTQSDTWVRSDPFGKGELWRLWLFNDLFSAYGPTKTINTIYFTNSIRFRLSDSGTNSPFFNVYNGTYPYSSTHGVRMCRSATLPSSSHATEQSASSLVFEPGIWRSCSKGGTSFVAFAQLRVDGTAVTGVLDATQHITATEIEQRIPYEGRYGARVRVGGLSPAMSIDFAEGSLQDSEIEIDVWLAHTGLIGPTNQRAIPYAKTTSQPGQVDEYVFAVLPDDDWCFDFLPPDTGNAPPLPTNSVYWPAKTKPLEKTYKLITETAVNGVSEFTQRTPSNWSKTVSPTGVKWQTSTATGVYTVEFKFGSEIPQIITTEPDESNPGYNIHRRYVPEAPDDSGDWYYQTGDFFTNPGVNFPSSGVWDYENDCQFVYHSVSRALAGATKLFWGAGVIPSGWAGNSWTVTH